MIAPKFFVIWGTNGASNVSMYYTRHHAEQFLRALSLNGTPCRLEVAA